MSEAEQPPEMEPLITRDFDGYRVAVIRNGRVLSYLCETEAEAKRWAEVLSKPPVEPPARQMGRIASRKTGR